MRLFSVDEKKQSPDSTYSRKIGVPQYVPSDVCPELDSLLNYEKCAKLLHAIENSSVSDAEKKFLRFAAYRHVMFNYSKIADYYAHADPEMQKLMEQSALVIIDVDDAIVNGYVKLSKNILKMLDESGEPANE